MLTSIMLPSASLILQSGYCLSYAMTQENPKPIVERHWITKSNGNEQQKANRKGVYIEIRGYGILPMGYGYKQNWL